MEYKDFEILAVTMKIYEYGENEHKYVMVCMLLLLLSIIYDVFEV